FLQGEDGIRDRNVTGVQTCALPICTGMEARRKLISVIIHIVLVLMSITMLVPFLWMILTAFKSVSEATQVNPFLIFPTVWRTEYFTEVMENMNLDRKSTRLNSSHVSISYAVFC